MLKQIFTLLFLVQAIVVAEGPIAELIEPAPSDCIYSGPAESIDDNVIVRKWEFTNCTSDVFQEIQFYIHDSDGIDWSSLIIDIVTYGGTIGHGEFAYPYWWEFPPGLPDSVYDDLCWSAQQDYSLIIDIISDTSGLLTIIPEGRGERPPFVCCDDCGFGFYIGPCCLNAGDINSPGFGHYVAPNWDMPNFMNISIMDSVGDWGSSGGYFCVDYSGPSASHPLPSHGSYIDTVFPTISIVILDTICVRHTAYPNPWEPWFPHCAASDSTCVDSLGNPLEFPYGGVIYIEWSPVDEQSISLSVNGYEYGIDSPGMQWIDDSLLVFNTGEAGLTFADGETVHVCLEEATDRVTQGYGPNHLGRHGDWTHPDTPVPFCWEFYIGEDDISAEKEKPKKLAIESISPNPFNSSVSISYSLESDCNVLLDVYDVLGHHVLNLVENRLSAGSHSKVWTAPNDIPSGIYFVRLKAGDLIITKRAVLMK